MSVGPIFAAPDGLRQVQADGSTVRLSRDLDADAIARFIAERGVTRCPTVFMWPSQAARDMRGSLPAPRTKQRWVQPGGSHHRNKDRMRRRLADIRANEDAGR